MPNLAPADAITGWADGWAWSRGAGRPRSVEGTWRVEVGAERESVRWLLPHPTPELLEALLARDHPPHTAVKLVGDPEVWEPRFPSGWRADIPVWLMWSPLSAEPVLPLPTGYDLVVERPEDHVVTVRVTAPDGAPAARGQVGLGEEYAVPDRIVTEPDHQRRGLGSVVMTELGNAAVAAGRLRAVLGATAEGRSLYRSLGWQVVGRRTGMYLRPDP